MGCNNVVRLGTSNWGGTMYAWDGHKFGCEDDFSGEGPCLVYTFGVGKEDSFEEAMAATSKAGNLGLSTSFLPSKWVRSEYVHILKDVRYMHMTTQSRISHLQSTTISTLQRLDLVSQTP